MSTYSPEKPVSWLQALAHALALSILFMVVYGGASWITSLRSDVGTWYYAWEKYIPFVPIFIIPYMSIDLLFFAAPFLCSDQRELWLLSKRITLGIVVAGCCFLIYPLKLAVDRPTLDGWLGVVWNWFIGMDRPFNLLPSLHITLRTILAATYARHTRGVLRVVSSVWFSLIGFSTLLVHQHHIVDVIGGFILATACFYLVNDSPMRLADGAELAHRLAVCGAGIVLDRNRAILFGRGDGSLSGRSSRSRSLRSATFTPDRASSGRPMAACPSARRSCSRQSSPANMSRGCITSGSAGLGMKSCPAFGSGDG